MTAFPAAGLTIETQLAASDGTITVIFNWFPGFGNAGETVNYQFIDVTAFPYDFTCGQPERFCIQLPAVQNSYILTNLRPQTYYGWRINTNFHFGPGNDQFVLSNPIQTSFLTNNRIQSLPFPPNPLPPFPLAAPTTFPANPLPPFPFIEPRNTVNFNKLPGFPGAGGVIPPPINGGPFSSSQIANFIWAATNLPGQASSRQGDALAFVFAIAEAESSYNPNECGDCDPGNIHPGESQLCASGTIFCGGQLACSWGLFQLNRCNGGQGSGIPIINLTDPQFNANHGVPPIMDRLNVYGMTNTRDYTLQQIANAAATSGHPGGTPDTTNALIININTAYQRVKYTLRTMDFPTSSAV